MQEIGNTFDFGQSGAFPVINKYAFNLIRHTYKIINIISTIVHLNISYITFLEIL